MLSFLGIGAQKAGTTWLYTQLVRHPQIGFPLGKEVHFWDRPGKQSEDDYLARFKDSQRCEGEITPAYALLPVEKIRQIYRAAPNLRLVFIMRDPLERAWSAALMALERAEMRLQDASEQWFIDHFRSAGSLARGDYADCIRRWRAVFPAEQLLLLRYEDVVERPEQVLQQCCRHLGVSPPPESMLAKCREVVFSGPRYPMPPRLRRTLIELYRPRVAALEALLGKECTAAWLSPDAPPDRRWARPRLARALGRLRHFRRDWRDRKDIRNSGLFDASWYLAHNPDVARAGVDPLHHFVAHGAAEKRDPGPGFAMKGYLTANPDVASAGGNPLLHYLRFGKSEGRLPMPMPMPMPLRETKRSEPQRQVQKPLQVRDRPKAERHQRALFADFSGYERSSMFLTELAAPFSQSANCVLGHMDAVRTQLLRRYAASAPQSLVSVIMPVAPDMTAGIERAIDSVLAQTWTNFELIVVESDGGDGAHAALSAATDARIVRLNGVQDGRSARINAGLMRSRGEFVAYIDGDSVWAPDFLRLLVGSLQGNVDIDMAYCAGQRVVATDASTSPVVEAVSYEVFVPSMMENRPCFALGSVLHRRELLERAGYFDERLSHLGDWEFLLRSTQGTAPVGVPCVLYSTSRCAGRDDAKIRDELPALRALQVSQGLGGHLAVGKTVPGAATLHCMPHARDSVSSQRKVSIVIPSFECLEYLRLCIDSVQAFTDPVHQLIVVDNASSLPVRAFLAELSRAGRAIVIQNSHNLGFSYAANQGIEVADRSTDIVLLNNDALVTRGWLAALQQVLEDRPDTGLIVPRQVLPAGTDTVQTHNPSLDPGFEADVTLSLHHDNVLNPLLDQRRSYVELSFATFFCVYIPRRTIDEVGLLDHQRAPHYCSDNLYCEAVRRIAGRKIVYTPHAKVYHFLQKATSTLNTADPGMYQDMFVRNEWGDVVRRAGLDQPPNQT